MILPFWPAFEKRPGRYEDRYPTTIGEKGVHSAFGEQFAKSGALDPKYPRWLLSAFNKRIAGDYVVDAAFTCEDLEQVLAQTREFLLVARRFLGSFEGSE